MSGGHSKSSVAMLRALINEEIARILDEADQPDRVVSWDQVQREYPGSIKSLIDAVVDDHRVKPEQEAKLEQSVKNVIRACKFEMHDCHTGGGAVCARHEEERVGVRALLGSMGTWWFDTELEYWKEEKPINARWTVKVRD